MAAGDLDHHLDQGGGVEFVAAEHPGLDDAIEAGVLDRLVDLVGVPAPLVGLLLLRAQHVAQAAGALDHRLGGEARLRLGNGLDGRGGPGNRSVAHFARIPSAPISVDVNHQQWRGGARG